MTVTRLHAEPGWSCCISDNSAANDMCNMPHGHATVSCVVRSTQLLLGLKGEAHTYTYAQAGRLGSTWL